MPWSPAYKLVVPLDLWLSFVLASAVLLVIPGPTILTVMGYSLGCGRRAMLPLVAAVALGDSTALVLSLLGLGALLASSAMWFSVVKTLGGLYLLFLGVKLMRSGLSADSVNGFQQSSPSAKVAANLTSRWRLFANTYLVTAFNPKGLVFFVAFLPQFVAPDANAARQLWLLAATFVALASANATLYALFAASASRVLSSRPAQRRFNISGGLLLSAAGVWALLVQLPA